jgi:hypothetical protein
LTNLFADRPSLKNDFRQSKVLTAVHSRQKQDSMENNKIITGAMSKMRARIKELDLQSLFGPQVHCAQLYSWAETPNNDNYDKSATF